MAMGRRGRDEAERAIASCRPFRNSTGSFRGTEGSTRNVGYLYNHPDVTRIKELLRRATYVVWSYQTPIGCVTEDEVGNITKVYFEAQHSTTTSNHQATLMCAFSDFETIGERPQRTRRPRLLRAVRTDGSHQDTYSATDRPVGVRDRVVQRYPSPSTSGPEFIAPDESSQRVTLEQMLDSRYADPNWTPFAEGPFSGNLPEGADQRDRERVEREGPWRP